MRRLIGALLLLLGLWSGPALAATCSPAASQGAAPPSWQTYCWLDFSSYNDTTARSAGGQVISYSLNDGSTLSFTVKASGGATASLAATAAPSWTGAAVGNTSFLGIPGKPILYTVNSGTTTLTISSISVAPPPGAPAITVFAFVAADAESTDNNESIQFTTDGTAWVQLDKVAPITGSQYPTATGIGTTTFTEAGAGLTGNVGGYIVGSNTPKTITTTFVAGGLEGAMFAVRFASIRLFKTIGGARADPADQFTFKISGTGSGAVFGTGTTSGATNGPFPAAAVSFASGLPLTLSEVMASGSVSTFMAYRSLLSCINLTPSSTVLPTSLATTSYNFGSLQFGDTVECTFTNTPYPRLKLAKALGGARVFANDQFVMRLTTGATVVATTTTTGAASTVLTGTIPSTQVTSGTAYGLDEQASGTTNLAYYAQTMACTNASGSATVLPTAVPATITPVMGDVVTCTLTNTPKSPTATLVITKSSAIVFDPINGATNPKAIPGAVIRYSIRVVNSGTLAVDSSTVVITDPVPANMSLSVAAPAVTLTDGAPPSGLAFTAATDVTYSSQAGGGTPYSYTPVADANGYDALVKGLRIAPSGTMAGATAAGQTSFTVSYLMRVN